MTDEELHAKLQEMMETLTNDGHSEDEAVTRITDILEAGWSSLMSPEDPV